MNKLTSYHSTNFIRRIIEKDLTSGKYNTIHTRFPPEPNGYLHIGHAKSICLNFGIAEDYNGKCSLRFDDTNPVKEDIKYIESIKKDILWLGFKWHGNVHYSSDYFDKLYDYAIELINKGLAYVDELSSNQIRKYRGTLTTPGQDSPYRNRNIKENLFLFEEMRAGKVEEGKMCLRAKIDMTSSFVTMRDPVLYRIKFAKHHQTGNKWCIYPTYDFAHCISDALENITHSLCTLEFQDNRHLYNWILNNINISKRPNQYEFSRLNLEYTVMSKRKLGILVSNKYVDGWDDPRMPTISGLRRRGYTAKVIRKFCKSIGITRQSGNIIKIASLESCIREDLNEEAPRVMVVIDPIRLVIENYQKEKNEVFFIPNHPNKPEMGVRKVPFSNEIWIDRADFQEKASKNYKRLVLGEEIRLRNAYIIKAKHVEKDSTGEIITIYCTYDANTLGKNPIKGYKIKKVIHWVSIAHAIPVEIRLYDYLFKISNPESIDDFLTVMNHESLLIKQGYAEQSLKNVEIGKAYQFEREGYFCLDNVYTTINKLVFNRIVSLRGVKSNFKKLTNKYQ